MEKYNINQTTLKILGLYRTDYRRPCYVREVSREVKVDVKATQLQLKRLERMNILSSVSRGRIKEYRLNLANQIGLYLMTMAEVYFTVTYLNRNFPVKKLVSEVRNRIEGTTILFGSFAKAQATSESDIDLLILDEKEPPPQLFKPVGSIIGKRISLKHAPAAQFLESLRQNDPLAREVVASHVILKGADEFCNIMWQYYA